jgi:hypothetical protein
VQGTLLSDLARLFNESQWQFGLPAGIVLFEVLGETPSPELSNLFVSM